MEVNRVSSLILILSTVFLISAEGILGADETIVKLPKGRIQGHILKSSKGASYYAFQDIPYAAPPVGENRFKVPKEHEGWNGILDATNNTKICHQGLFPGTVNIILPPTNATQSEDCLFLNVYTPVKPGGNDSLSVFVFLHLGAYVFGDGSFEVYGPKHLMDHNIVVVTMNYRLDALGFLTTGDGVIPGNLGLKDQNFALKWVNKNIKLFGGDPKKVTLGGGSAGSMSTAQHLLSKKSRGLFSSAILQSGTINSWGYQATPREYAFTLGNILDNSIGYTNSTKLLSVLQKASAADIMAASQKVPNQESNTGVVKDSVFVPIIEDPSLDDTFLTVPMHDAFRDGKFTRVPTLVGFNDEEGITFYPLSMYIYFNLDSKNMSLLGDKLWKFYTGNTSFIENPGSLLTFSSDDIISRSIIRFADITSKYTPTYFYKLSYGGEPFVNFPGVGTVGHAFEIPIIWDWTFLPDKHEFDNVIRQRMLKLWTNFIKYHNPTPISDPLLLNAKWPALKPGKLNYFNINVTFSIGTNPRHYNEVKKLYDQYVHSPLVTY
nr:uncharacterized protein LOC111503313 [Leptinotarsa decemlineata]